MARWYSKNSRVDGSAGRATRVYAEEIAGSNPVRRAHLTHFCIVRDDLPRGTLASQVVHAAGESALEPVKTGTHAVVLSVPTEADLHDVERRLVQFGVPHTAIREPDEPWCGALMAIGVVPMVPTKQLRKVTKKLRLLK